MRYEERKSTTGTRMGEMSEGELADAEVLIEGAEAMAAERVDVGDKTRRRVESHPFIHSCWAYAASAANASTCGARKRKLTWEAEVNLADVGWRSILLIDCVRYTFTTRWEVGKAGKDN